MAGADWLRRDLDYQLALAPEPPRVELVGRDVWYHEDDGTSYVIARIPDHLTPAQWLAGKGRS